MNDPCSWSCGFGLEAGKKERVEMVEQRSGGATRCLTNQARRCPLVANARACLTGQVSCLTTSRLCELQYVMLGAIRGGEEE